MVFKSYFVPFDQVLYLGAEGNHVAIAVTICSLCHVSLL